jgi:F-type H+-transporting ATPase subunit b
VSVSYPTIFVLAQEAETEEETHAEGEEAHAEEGHHENNFFYGDINEVIWGSVAFAIILAVFLWKGVPAVKKVMLKQQEAIAAKIAAAEATKAQEEAELARLTASLGNADEEAARIVADARERAEVVEADLKRRAEVEIQETLQRTRIEIEASKHQALADLREEIAAMTVTATEAILKDMLNDSVRSSLVDHYIDQVGAAS